MNKKQKISISFMILAMILILTFGAYSFFITNGQNNIDMETSIEAGEMSLTFNDGDNGINKSLQFGETITKAFSIENTGNVNSSLSLHWTNLINKYLNGSLTYNLTCKNEHEDIESEIIPMSNVPTSYEPLEQILAGEISVEANSTTDCNLNIKLNNTDFDQTNDIEAIFQTNFKADQPLKYLYYILQIDPNGGTWNEFTSTQEYRLLNNETFNIPEPTKIGYTFAGWEKSGNSIIDGTTLTMGIGNTTLQAKWIKNKYKVTIDNGTEQPIEEICEFGSTLNLTQPLKEGYTFTGWSTTGGSIENNILSINEPKNINVTANWIINRYKYIVYHNKMNLNGEGYTLIDADTDEKEAEFNSIVTPSVKNYQGFKLPQTKDLTIKAENTYPPILNKIEYNYDRNKYNLTVNLNGGSSETTGGEMYYESSKNLGVPTKKGYNFTNWTTTSGTITDNIFKMDSKDATITANFTPKVYTITFNPNGGTTPEASKQVLYDSTYGSLPIPTYTGYEFLGWYTNSTDGNLITSDLVVNLENDQTLFAKWKRKQVTITLDSQYFFFDTKNTISTKTKVVTVGEPYGELEMPNSYGNNPNGNRCAFKSWQINGSEITDKTIVTITSDHTLTPRKGSCFTTA